MRFPTLCAVLCLLIPQPISAASPDQFELRAAISISAPTAGSPVALVLPPEILQKARPDQGDLRIFTDQESEVPFVLVRSRETSPGSLTPRSYEVLSYAEEKAPNTAHADIFTLKTPQDVATQVKVEIITSARNFKKDVTIEGSSDQKSWHVVTTDSIFDFSAKVDLRETSIQLPEISDPYLRVTLLDSATKTAGGAQMHLEFQGLKFDAPTTPEQAQFKVDAFRAWPKRVDGKGMVRDSLTIDSPKTSELQPIKERGGRVSEIDLGILNLPVDKVTLLVSNAYFFRSLLVYNVTGDDRHSQFELIGESTIYRIPDTHKSHQSVELNGPTSGNVRLRIKDGDSPPLSISTITVSWPRRTLYFIPEAGREHSLYFRNATVTGPHYDMSNIYSDEQLEQQSSGDSSLLTTTRNSLFKPFTEQSKAVALSNYLTGIVLALMIGMSVWVYRLLRKAA